MQMSKNVNNDVSMNPPIRQTESFILKYSDVSRDVISSVTWFVLGCLKGLTTAGRAKKELSPILFRTASIFFPLCFIATD